MTFKLHSGPVESNHILSPEDGRKKSTNNSAFFRHRCCFTAKVCTQHFSIQMRHGKDKATLVLEGMTIINYHQLSRGVKTIARCRAI
jgi:hypothetical protein